MNAPLEVVTWQTFANGTKHLRLDVNGEFKGYLQQTPENVARAVGERQEQQLDFEADLIEPATGRSIDEALAAAHASEPPRGHLGMSQIGNPDERTLWLKFRWSLPDVPAPRTLRIFQLGHYVEIELARLLRMIPGVDLHTTTEDGGQFSFKQLGGHFAGSMDGAIVGIPEAPKTWHVWEAKSVSGKRFAQLVKDGVQKWSAEYYAQLQCYMGSTGMERSLFTAYNKDDSTLHIERVKREPMFWEAMQEKARRIVQDRDMPASSFRDRTWYEAKFMSEDAQAVYWGDRLPRPNCRNCRFVEAVTDRSETTARWHCYLHRDDRTRSQQFQGCEKHQYLPTFIEQFAKMERLPDDDDAVIYSDKETGALFANGQRSNPPGVSEGNGWPCWSSDSLYRTRGTRAEPMLIDHFAAELNKTFGAQLRPIEEAA